MGILGQLIAINILDLIYVKIIAESNKKIIFTDVDFFKFTIKVSLKNTCRIKNNKKGSGKSRYS